MLDQPLRRQQRPAGEMPEGTVYLMGAGEMLHPTKFVRGNRSGMVMVVDCEIGRVVTIVEATEIFDAYIPECWEDARLDIEFALMQMGAL
jgi:hypothetical protein